MSKQASPIDAPAASGAPCGFSLFDGATLDAWLGANEAYGKLCSAVSREVGQFMNTRLNVDARYVRALGECHDLAELAKTHQDWAMAATRDYLDEAAKLWHLTQELGPECVPQPSVEATPSRAAEKKAA